MDIRLTHADADKNEVRYIEYIEQFDAQISIESDASLNDNSFSLKIPSDEWLKSPVLEGHFIYIDGTEFGGPVEQIQHSTAEDAVTVAGPTWRGMLMRKIIEPPEGEAYRTLTGDASAVVSAVMTGTGMTIDTTLTGIPVTGSWRYQQLHAAIIKTLEGYGLTLDIKYSAADKTAIVSVRQITDHSSEIDLSQDYGLDMRSNQGRVDGYNHIIALGAGELLDRDIVHVYRLDNGTITTTPPAWVGTVADRVIIYDFNNPEDLAALIAGASKRLSELAPREGLEIDPSDADIDLPLGDIVGARDRVTGLAATARIVGKILTISEDGLKIDTKVG